MRARKNAAALAFAPSVSFAFSFSFPSPTPDWQCPPRGLSSLSLFLSLVFPFAGRFLLFRAARARASSSVSRESRERDDETRKRERRWTGERVSVKDQRRSEFSSVFVSFGYSAFGRFEKHRGTRRGWKWKVGERTGNGGGEEERKRRKKREIRLDPATKRRWKRTNGRTRRLFRWIRSKVKANARAFVAARLRNSTRLGQSLEFLVYRGVTRTAVPSFSNVRRPVLPRVVIRPDHLRCK